MKSSYLSRVIISIAGLAIFGYASSASASSYNVTIINKTDCPIQYTTGGAKQSLKPGDTISLSPNMGQPVAIYESVVLNNQCTAGASNTAAIFKYNPPGKNYIEEVDQGQTAWGSSPISAHVTLDGSYDTATPDHSVIKTVDETGKHQIIITIVGGGALK